jgi:predicted nucleic-acid-binding protein
MNSIRDEFIALDTNEFIFALRREPSFPDSETLLFDKLPELKIYMPLQILLELERNLNSEEMRATLLALTQANAVIWDYARAPLELIQQWEQRGAKKGDAIIAAHMDAARIRYFISENRHFLAEITGLPFQVMTSKEVLGLLG